MKQVFKTRTFIRWIRKVGITDNVLSKAVDEMARGLIDADLGGGIVKKRLAIPGQGKRGGVRTIVATKKEDRWVFLFGYTKNERTTIEAGELKALQELAKEYLEFDACQIRRAVEKGVLTEIDYGGHEK